MDYVDDSQGRQVRHRAFVCPDACHHPALQQWHGLRQVLAVETLRHVANRDKTQCEIRYFLSSCDTSAKVQIRHWGIENRLHWVLFEKMSVDNSARCFAILRKIALNLIRQDPSSRNSIRAKRKKTGWSNNYMDSILFGKFRA